MPSETGATSGDADMSNLERKLRDLDRKISSLKKTLKSIPTLNQIQKTEIEGVFNDLSSVLDLLVVQIKEVKGGKI